MNTNEENLVKSMSSESTEKQIADSLDINDPELIKFMNTKMNMVDKTLIDVFYDILIFAFEKGVYTPCKYLYEYFEEFDYTQIISKDFFKQFETTLFLSYPVMDKTPDTNESQVPLLSGESESETDNVIIEK